MIRLDGKAALVTGATRSMGEQIARSLHAAGAAVAVTGVDDASGSAVAASLVERAIYLHLDVTDDAQIDACLAQARSQFGRLDIVVNCACSYLDAGLATPRADWLAALNVNVVGPAILIHKAAPLLTQPGGVIVNLGSIGGKFGNATRGAYAAGKAALMQITRNAAAALAPAGIRVVTVSPGWTWSAPTQEMTGNDRDWADRAGAHTHPLGRMGRTAEVADVVVFACSEHASWVNGCDLPVDGGFSMLGPDQGRGAGHWLNLTR